MRLLERSVLGGVEVGRSGAAGVAGSPRLGPRLAVLGEREGVCGISEARISSTVPV